jgi:hypothetical protein
MASPAGQPRSQRTAVCVRVLHARVSSPRQIHPAATGQPASESVDTDRSARGRARGRTRACMRGAASRPYVLVAELKVAEDNRDLGAGEQEDEQHQHQEPEDVVEALLPAKNTRRASNASNARGPERGRARARNGEAGGRARRGRHGTGGEAVQCGSPRVATVCVGGAGEGAGEGGGGKARPRF